MSDKAIEAVCLFSFFSICVIVGGVCYWLDGRKR